MFYGISAHQEEWKERLNLWIALGPVTRLDHSKSKIMFIAAKFYTNKLIKEVADYFNVWYTMGHGTNLLLR
jgi:hypothetical protein